MKLFAIKKDDSWPAIINKLDEESKEAQAEMFKAANTTRDKSVQETIAEELLDTIQVCIGGLDKLADEGYNIRRAAMLHRDKLIGRGHQPKYFIQITKKKVL